MADRDSSTNPQRKITAKAGFFVLTAIFATPALAATSSRIPCSEGVEATLNVAISTLITETVGHKVPKPSIIKDALSDGVSVVSSASLLGPRAEEAIRAAFEEVDSAELRSSDTDPSESVLTPPMAGTKSKLEATQTDDKGVVSGMNTKLPGVSDDAMARYKKQMFRRDI
jgi:hypothetical protein